MGQQDLDLTISDIYDKTYKIWQSSRKELTKDHDYGFKVVSGFWAIVGGPAWSEG